MPVHFRMKKGKSYFILFDKIPDRELVEETSKIAYENEEIIIKTNVFIFTISLDTEKRNSI